MSGDIFGYHDEVEGGLLLAASGWRPGMLLKTLQCTEHPPTNHPAPVPTELRMRNPFSEASPPASPPGFDTPTSLPNHTHLLPFPFCNSRRDGSGGVSLGLCHQGGVGVRVEIFLHHICTGCGALSQVLRF